MQTYYVLKFDECSYWPGLFVHKASWSVGFPEARINVIESTHFKTRKEAEAYATMFGSSSIRKDYAIEPVAYTLTVEVTR